MHPHQKVPGNYKWTLTLHLNMKQTINNTKHIFLPTKFVLTTNNIYRKQSTESTGRFKKAYRAFFPITSVKSFIKCSFTV